MGSSLGDEKGRRQYQGAVLCPQPREWWPEWELGVRGIGCGVALRQPLPANKESDKVTFRDRANVAAWQEGD